MSSRPKKKKANFETFEATEHDNKFARISLSMAKSKAYKRLSAQAKVLYTCMKFQMHSQESNNLEKGCFHFNQAMFIKGHENGFELFSNWGRFSQYCNELVDNGFIEFVARNGNTREKNIYRFSDKWKFL